MKISIIGATGKQGILLLEEAIKRGHEVTAIARDVKKINNSKAKLLEKDVFSLTYEDLKDFDVIIDAFAAWTEDTLIQHQTSLKHLSDILKDKKNRLLVVGGAGSLYTDAKHTIPLMESPGFPDMFKPLAESMGKAFDALKSSQGVNWTYLSPAANFDAEGAGTGSYKIGEDELILNSAGDSYISYVDYAIAMIDEAEKGNFIKKRFTVVGD